MDLQNGNDSIRNVQKNRGKRQCSVIHADDSLISVALLIGSIAFFFITFRYFAFPFELFSIEEFIMSSFVSFLFLYLEIYARKTYIFVTA